MEIKKRYTNLQNALATLKKSIDFINDPQYEKVKTQMQDSAIQRFEYTIDFFWKFLRRYIEHQSSTTFELVSPREVIKQGLHHNFITEQEHTVLNKMLADRNQTSHTYNEEVALIVVEHIIKYYETLKIIIDRLKTY